MMSQLDQVTEMIRAAADFVRWAGPWASLASWAAPGLKKLISRRVSGPGERSPSGRPAPRRRVGRYPGQRRRPGRRRPGPR